MYSNLAQLEPVQPGELRLFKKEEDILYLRWRQRHRQRHAHESCSIYGFPWHAFPNHHWSSCFNFGWKQFGLGPVIAALWSEC